MCKICGGFCNNDCSPDAESVQVEHGVSHIKCQKCGDRTFNRCKDCGLCWGCCPSEYDDDFDPNKDEGVFGYECLGCGNIQACGGECERCCAYAMEPMYG